MAQSALSTSLGNLAASLNLISVSSLSRADWFGWRAPATLRKWLLGDSRAELDKSITSHLVISGETLLHLESGQQQNLYRVSGDRAEESDGSGHNLSLSTEIPDAAAIAEAASQILSTGDKNGNSGTKTELLLAPSEFLATTQDMPGVSAASLGSAVALQREFLLPACETELVLAVAAPPAADNEDHCVTALWFSAARLQQLHNEFAARGLELIAVQPRVLCTAGQTQPVTVVEQNSTQMTAVTIADGLVIQWLQTMRSDLEQPEFAEQWQSALNSMPNTQNRVVDYSELCPADSLSVNSRYRFYPAGALADQQRLEKSRQLVLTASLLIGLLLLSAVPFLMQSVELGLARSRLQSAQELAAGARADQALVVEFEKQWGAINDFPDQQLRQAMFRLQDLLAGEHLASLELDEGLIRIQGSSADPQAILQRLEQDVLFSEVVFSRATSNTRYFIDLRLATVSFDAYMVRHFPEPGRAG